MGTIDFEKRYKIRDGIDLYLVGENFLSVYFMSSRRRMTFRVSRPIVELLERLDGRRPLSEIIAEMSVKSKAEALQFRSIVEQMHKYNMLACCETHEKVADYPRFERQINYFADFFEDEEYALRAQSVLGQTRIAIFGCGAVGGDVALLLGMAGVRKFILIDDDTVESADVSRHMFFRHEYIGRQKIEVLAAELRGIDSQIEVLERSVHLTPETSLDEILDHVDFVVNTMDDPYIGYTSSKISRACFAHGIAHFVAGGFDAHLASTGELVIPYQTPCVECYASHFKKVLAGWRPRNHPVKRRHLEIGGLASMSLFSASYAAIDIIKYLCGLDIKLSSTRSRGELLFNDMELTYLDVKRDPDCRVCGGLHES